MTAGKVIKSSILINRLKDDMIEQIRHKCTGLKQREIAKILGITQPRVSTLMNASKSESFSTETLLSYCYVLGVSVKVEIGGLVSLECNSDKVPE